MAYDPEGNLIGEKVIKEGPTASFMSSANKSRENSIVKAFSVKGKEHTIASEKFFSPSLMTLREPTLRTIEYSRHEDYQDSCKTFESVFNFLDYHLFLKTAEEAELSIQIVAE